MTVHSSTDSSAVVIRPARPADQASSDGLPPLRPDGDGPRWRRTVVAERAGEVVGLASMQLDPVTENYLCEVVVAPAHRRAGIGTSLYGAACQLLERPYRVQARAMARQPLRRLFAEALGCELVRHHPEPWADPTTTPWRQWIDAHPVPDGHTALTLAEADPAGVRRAWLQYDEWSHAPVGPVRPHHLVDAWERYRSGLDADTSTVVVEEAAPEEVLAFCLVSAQQWEGRTLAVSETAAPDQEDGVAFLEAAVARTLLRLGARGVRRVELEGHSDDPHFPVLVAGLPEHDADPMDLLALRRPAAG
ncbi:GNAT family N-acetyltransferase [Desertihabitans brevis]|uniref:GNAT family N-acetyltransferase n=1 Tax=Desertihabitans brevis TaxID=2268447 RepID=A0A367YTR6_9ACTN|nr:GNAT family N-acetyltransferase [Desertihabitans brevis]